MPRSPWIALALAVALLAGPPVAAADPPPCPEVPPHDDQVRARLAWIERRFANDEADTARWAVAVGCLQFFLLSMNIGNIIVGPSDGQRIDGIVNGIGSALSLGSLFLNYPPVLGAGAFMRELPRSSPEERLSSLRRAERRLQAAGDTARTIRSAFTMAQSAVVNDALALILVLLGRTTQGYITAIGGPVLVVGRALLHPSGPQEAWDTYRRRHPEAGCEELGVTTRRSDLRLDVTPAVSTAFGGASLSLTF